MPSSKTTLRILIVDDNRDGADALGMLLEELGNDVHVTYSGSQALDVATAFRPDLLLFDLVMPEMDGCLLAQRFRQIPMFAKTRIIAITGHKDAEKAAMAVKAGFNALLHKPVSLLELKAQLDDVVRNLSNPPPKRPPEPRKRSTDPLLPIRDARRIRSERTSKNLTIPESEAAICEGIIRFQEEYMGRRSEKFQARFVKDLLVVRIHGALTHAEQQLGKSASPEKGRDLIKQVRKQLLETARPMLESLIHEVTGVKVTSMHHDISTVTGEEVILFSLVTQPDFAT